MILKTYLFAQNGGNYQQYVSDQSEAFLKSVCKNCKSENQIAIHRDGNLMYYAFAHKVTISEIYGICIVCGEICLNISELFDFFIKTIDWQAKKGILFKYDKEGKIRKNINNFGDESAEIDNMYRYIKQYLESMESFWLSLPPEDFTVPKNSAIRLSLKEDEQSRITEAQKHYHNIFVTLENSVPSSYSRTVARLNSENDVLRKSNNSLYDEISNLRHKQKNMLWVSILSLVVLVMGVILYFKVINPSEVTKFQTGEFIYYGPLKNKKPNGEGVAFYPSTDKYGRKYYIGNFIDGERQDSTAMLFYQNGDYYYGSMKGDKWEHGLFYNNTDNSHYKGDFNNNKPYNGVWYYHEKAYELKNGKR